MCRDNGGKRAAHLCQLIESDRLLKQAFVLGLESHFTDDGSCVPGKLIYNTRLEERGRAVEEITVRIVALPLWSEGRRELSKRQK